MRSVPRAVFIRWAGPVKAAAGVLARLPPAGATAPAEFAPPVGGTGSWSRVVEPGAANGLP